MTRVAVLGVGAVGRPGGPPAACRPRASTQVVLRDERHDRLDTIARSLGDGAGADRASFADPVEADVRGAGRPGRGPRRAGPSAAGAGPVGRVDRRRDRRRPRACSTSTPRPASGACRSSWAPAFAPGLTCVLAAHAAVPVRRGRRDPRGQGSAPADRPAPASTTGRSAGMALDWRDRRVGAAPGRQRPGAVLVPRPDRGRGLLSGRAARRPASWCRPSPGSARVTARLAANRRDRLTARLPMLRPPHPEGGPGAVRVEVRGRRGGSRDVTVLGAMDRPAVAAGAVAALSALWAAQGRLRRAGAGGLAELVDPVPFLAELRRRGCGRRSSSATPAARRPERGERSARPRTRRHPRVIHRPVLMAYSRRPDGPDANHRT